MKIALLVSGFNKDAKEALNITTRNLALLFKEKGNEVSIITKQKKGEKQIESYRGIDIYRLYQNPLYPKVKFNVLGAFVWLVKNILIFPQTIKKIKKQFEIIHGFSSAPILVLRSIFSRRYFKNAKIVHTIKGYSRYGYKFARFLNLADKITVPSEIIKNKLVKRGCKASKINVIHSPVDLKRFRPLNKQILKNKYGFKNKNVVLYYGHMTELKGINYLLDAIKLIEDKNIVFLFVSSSTNEFNEPYKKRIRNEKISNAEIITKDVKVEEYVNLADVVILPYPNLISTEANPSCLIESMACKTPVVTTDLPELIEIVTPGKDVLMVKPKDSQSLAQSIINLLNDKKLQKKLAESAYKKSKQFDVRIITQKYIELYENLLKE